MDNNKKEPIDPELLKRIMEESRITQYSDLSDRKSGSPLWRLTKAQLEMRYGISGDGITKRQQIQLIQLINFPEVL